MEFAIVDIETTGGNSKFGGITEIAILIHDGTEIKDTFQTLLNPQQRIPDYITGLTGIDNAMVQDAPLFEEVAEQIWEMLADRVFVAHQVNFDFSFIREAFSALDKDFSPSKLCTVRLSRKAFPGLRSYGLGRICEHLRIPIEARHRAMGDAKATAILFDQVIKKQPEVVYELVKGKRALRFLPPNFPSHRFEQIPTECGVYYMLDSNSRVVYVGKAINIQERFRSHFSGDSTLVQKQALKAIVADLKWELTGSEFMALLLETLEIKRIWPKFNAAIKRPSQLWGLYSYQDGNGFTRFQIAKVRKNNPPLEFFFNQEEARLFLKDAVDNYQLCSKLTGIRSVPCATVQDDRCEGACRSAISPGSYNSKAQSFIENIQASKKGIQICIPGRTPDEVAVCVFEGGILKYYGYFESEESVDFSQMKAVPSHPETAYILRQFLPKFSTEQIKIIAQTVSPSYELPLGF